MFLGSNVTILGNIKIGNDVKVGANSLVLKEIPPGCTAVGSPAKVISINPKYSGANIKELQIQKNNLGSLIKN